MSASLDGQAILHELQLLRTHVVSLEREVSQLKALLMPTHPRKRARTSSEPESNDLEITIPVRVLVQVPGGKRIIAGQSGMDEPVESSQMEEIELSLPVSVMNSVEPDKNAANETALATEIQAGSDTEPEGEVDTAPFSNTARAERGDTHGRMSPGANSDDSHDSRDSINLLESFRDFVGARPPGPTLTQMLDEEIPSLPPSRYLATRGDQPPSNDSYSKYNASELSVTQWLEWKIPDLPPSRFV